MNYIKNWPVVKKRYEETWALENHDRPLLCVSACKTAEQEFFQSYNTIEEKWLDFDSVLKNVRRRIENTYYAAESIPQYNPNLGPDIFGAVLGCDITFGEDTSWCDHPVKSWDDFRVAFDENNRWLQRILSLTRLAVQEAKGDFLVGITDMHAGMDGLVSLRGPAELCMDLYDCPEKIEHLTMELFEVFKRLYNELESITSQNQEGTCNWMSAWHPGRWYVTSCDFNCMISTEAFRRFVFPELIAETEFFDANIYHLDGIDALKHLDDLLAIEHINGIQWVPGAGKKPMGQWKEELVKCQAAGKMLHLSCEPSDLQFLAEYLRPEGVILHITGANSPGEADDIVKMTEKLWKV